MRGMMRRAAALVVPAFADSGDSFSDSGSFSFSADSTDFFSDSTDFFSDSTDSFSYSAGDSSDSGSSMSVTSPPQPRGNQTHSVLQVLRSAAAPVTVIEELAFEGSASSVVSGTAINMYLRDYGQIPMIRSEVPDDVNLNALATPPNASQPPRQAVLRPVICAYCNCAFCFGADEAPSLDRGPGHVYPAPAPPAPNPITLNLLTPPAVWPLDRPVPRAPGATAMPECRLLVCSSKQHFKLTMGVLQQQHPGGAPPLEWPCTSCLRVLPIVVGSQGSNSPDLYANPPAPPLEPWRYAGAYWNYVQPGHEDMVELKLLHDDPLKLTLGRP